MDIYSFTMSVDQVEKIKIDLKEQGFEFKPLPYGYFKAANPKKKVSVQIYHSLKGLIQGKGTEEFVRFYLEPQILKTFNLDYGVLQYEEKIGMDEAGKGDYFGPLVVASVFVAETKFNILKRAGVRDSKTISDSQIQRFAELITKECPYHSLYISPEKYNHIYNNFKNLNKLLAWAHATCLKNLLSKTCANRALLDKFETGTQFEFYSKQMKIPIYVEKKIKAESDLAVASASILARSLFLKHLKQLSENYKIQLPKGASSQVDITAKEFVEKYSYTELKKVAKLHFRNTLKLFPQ